VVIVAFADLELDLSRVELRRSGERIRVEPQVFEVLAYLVEHRDRVVTKEELMDNVWGGRFVSETAVTSRIKQARQAIGDDGKAQRLIRTVHGRGYRFVGSAREAVPAPARQYESVHYAVSDCLQIAYQVTERGDRDIVLVAGFVSHPELDWADSRHAGFLDRLGSLDRLIRFDKRGTGMSDRPNDLPHMETRMHDVLAVMDAAGSDRAVLFGYSEGGPMSILMAAMHPERVEALVLYGTYARRLRGSPAGPGASRSPRRRTARPPRQCRSRARCSPWHRRCRRTRLEAWRRHGEWVLHERVTAEAAAPYPHDARLGAMPPPGPRTTPPSHD
jgi:DNA-binding winged helix-turn-helix (wHTH) protein